MEKTTTIQNDMNGNEKFICALFKRVVSAVKDQTSQKIWHLSKHYHNWVQKVIISVEPHLQMTLRRQSLRIMRSISIRRFMSNHFQDVFYQHFFVKFNNVMAAKRLSFLHKRQKSWTEFIFSMNIYSKAMNFTEEIEKCKL